MPPGWIKVASKSHPGAYYYAHPNPSAQGHVARAWAACGTGPRYDDLPEPAVTVLGKPLPGAKVQQAAQEAKEAQARPGPLCEPLGEEQRERIAALEAERRKALELQERQERRERLRQAEAAARLEAAATDEVARRARERRAAAEAAAEEMPELPTRRAPKAGGREAVGGLEQSTWGFYLKGSMCSEVQNLRGGGR